MKALIVRISDEDHYNLRKISFLTETKISELIREGISMAIKRYAKKLNKHDICITTKEEKESK